MKNSLFFCCSFGFCLFCLFIYSLIKEKLEYPLPELFNTFNGLFHMHKDISNGYIMYIDSKYLWSYHSL